MVPLYQSIFSEFVFSVDSKMETVSTIFILHNYVIHNKAVSDVNIMLDGVTYPG